MQSIKQQLSNAVALLVLPLVVLACDDPLPTGHDDGDATEDLQVDLTLSPDHVHIYSDVTFTVAVTDHHDEAVTDFEHIHVEYKETTETEWSEVELTVDGDVYTATHSFGSSGEYDVRITGQRPQDSAPVVMHERVDPLHAARAHAEAGGYSVEFEAFPGHIHEGDTGTLSFWIIDESSGGEDPITSLSPEVHVTESGEAEETHAATETDPGTSGVYEANHAFSAAGEATVAIHFTGSGGGDAEASFTFEVSHAH